MSCWVTEATILALPPGKTQISLGIHPVRPVFTVSTNKTKDLSYKQRLIRLGSLGFVSHIVPRLGKAQIVGLVRQLLKYVGVNYLQLSFIESYSSNL